MLWYMISLPVLNSWRWEWTRTFWLSKTRKVSRQAFLSTTLSARASSNLRIPRVRIPQLSQMGIITYLHKILQNSVRKRRTRFLWLLLWGFNETLKLPSTTTSWKIRIPKRTKLNVPLPQNKRKWRRKEKESKCFDLVRVTISICARTGAVGVLCVASHLHRERYQCHRQECRTLPPNPWRRLP